MPTLVDDFIPRPDAAERHSIVINASRDRVWQAITHLDPQDVRLAKPLLALRRLIDRSPGDRPKRNLPNFTPLAEDPMRELVVGTVGQWWRLGRAERTPAIGDVAAFRAFDQPGYAKATFSFLLDDAGPGRVRLVTETRVLATSPDARRAFRRYWIVIRLGSGLIRRVMLSAIRART
ncbi:hypothetical protein AB0H88_43335 [Nonomuraea sp. NPDC050680]|uniref:hypothetical protein n=1 Tax=Nonomuraea sp. NPDC050680 TaxID=3154630 RepID=UPI0033C7769C